jgi:hypothetical protein
MPDRARPAAYIRAARDAADLAHQRQAVADGAAQRGWPTPCIYLEHHADVAADRAPALAALAAAVEAGRHDALLIAKPAVPLTQLMSLLMRCTRHGVTVGLLLPPPSEQRERATGAAPPGQPERAAEMPGAAPPVAEMPAGRPDRTALLVRAQSDALCGLFPAWRIWHDDHGWHARRRSPFLECHGRGAPSYSVHAPGPAELAAQLCWQQAADEHAPNGCATG